MHMDTFVVSKYSIFVGKLTMYMQQVKCILLLQMLFLGHEKHWKASTDGEGPLGALVGRHGPRSSLTH